MAGFSSKDTLDALVRRWVDVMQADPKVADAIQLLDFGLSLNVKDLKDQYHLSFRGGHLTDGPGPDPVGSSLTLSMDSGMFAGLFSGREDGYAQGLRVAGALFRRHRRRSGHEWADDLLR